MNAGNDFASQYLRYLLAPLLAMNLAAVVSAQTETTPVADKSTPLDCFGDPLPAGAIARLGTVRLRNGYFLRHVLASPDGRTLYSADGLSELQAWDARTGLRRWHKVFPKQPSWDLDISPDGKWLLFTQGPRQPMRFMDAASGDDANLPHPIKTNCMGAVFSPNGKLVATLEYQAGIVRIWDFAEGKEMQKIDAGTQFVVRTLAFSPDSKLLAYPGKSEVRVWDIAAGKEAYRLDADKIKQPGCVAFSADGKLLAAANMYPRSGQADPAIYLFDAATGKAVGQCKGSGTAIRALAAVPKSNLLAELAPLDETIRLWNLTTRREERKLHGPPRGYTALAFSADGGTLVTGENLGALRLWNANTGDEIGPSAARMEELRWAAFAPDGRTLIAIGSRQFGLWEPLTGKPRRVFADKPRLSLTSSLSPDGKTLATPTNGGEDVSLWNTSEGRLLRHLAATSPGQMDCCAFSPDGRLLAIACAEQGIFLRSAADGKPIRTLKGQKRPRRVAFSPDGAFLASSSSNSRDDRSVRLWRLSDGAELWRQETQPWTTNELAFSPDGRLLALAGGLPGIIGQTGEVRLWDAVNGKELRHCDGHRANAFCVAFSADGRTLASGSADKTVRLWEVATGGQRQCFSGHQNWIQSLSFSPDGRMLASGSSDTTVLVWDLTGSFRDGKFQARRLSAEERKRCWSDLAAADAARAYQSIRALTAAGDESVVFLRDRLPPVKAADPKRVVPLVAALESNQFAERDRATAELEKLAFTAEPVLRQALKEKPSLESRRRIEQLLAKLQSRHGLRAIRAIEALEGIATPEARRVLSALAGGDAAALPTREAMASLKRLAKRTD